MDRQIVALYNGILFISALLTDAVTWMDGSNYNAERWKLDKKTTFWMIQFI